MYVHSYTSAYQYNLCNYTISNTLLLRTVHFMQRLSGRDRYLVVRPTIVYHILLSFYYYLLNFHVYTMIMCVHHSIFYLSIY